MVSVRLLVNPDYTDAVKARCRRPHSAWPEHAEKLPLRMGRKSLIRLHLRRQNVGKLL